MNRNQVTEKIISQKVLKGMKWEDVAKSLNKSKEWTTACCLGQMTCTQEQARILGELFRRVNRRRNKMATSSAT